jgi:cytochrome c556
MSLKFSALAFSAALVGTMALAADATDPIVVEQKNLMKSLGAASKVLGGMAGGGAYDAAAAEAAKAALMAGASDIAVKFAAPGNDPESESKPEIWSNWDDYLIKAKALGDAATAMDVSSVDGIKAGMGDIGGTCKACHQNYRM